MTPQNEISLWDSPIIRQLGLAAALHEYSENMFLTVSAGYLHRGLKIVAKCVEHKNGELFTRAGAAYVVSPYFIGGMRMASQLIRPNVVSFLDKMLRAGDGKIRVSEVTAKTGGKIIGKTLGEIDPLKNFGLNIIAVSEKDDEDFVYNPPTDMRIEDGSTLLIIGTSEQGSELEKAATS